MNNVSDTANAYRYARILLAVSVLLSLGCNAAHAFLNAAEVAIPLAVGVGTIPPLVLALAVESVVFCSRSARASWGWAAVIAAATTGVVTGFAMSFTAIRELGLMANMTTITAPMLPISIDSLIIVGLGMIALFRPVAAPGEPANHEVAQAVDHPVSWEDSGTDAMGETAPTDASDRGDSPANHADPHKTIAARVVARNPHVWSADTVAAVSRSTPAFGQRTIAEDLGISPSTVGRIRKAIAEVAA